MIDLDKARENFIKYSRSFDRNDERVRVKEAHCLRTEVVSEIIAKGLGLTEEQIDLAKLIGLLHDIGRFEQEELFYTFADTEECDHAKIAVRLLFEDGKIKEFTNEEKYYDIIRKAIANHNRYEIEDGLNDEELLFAKLIRDADKIDNFQVKQNSNLQNLLGETKEEVEHDKISEDVWEQFMQEKTILSSTRKTGIDHWLSYLAWIYDINFIPGLQYLLDKDSLNRVIDRFDYKDSGTKEQMEYARRVLHEYIKKKVALNS